MDLETCKQLIAHFEQRKSWSTKTLKTIMFDVVMGKPLVEPKFELEAEADVDVA